MKKYELTSDTIDSFGVKLFRIKALISFGNVKAGDLGGYVESEKNLSHYGKAWIYDSAIVRDKAFVCDNAKISGNAKMDKKAKALDNVCISGNAVISDDAIIEDNAIIKDRAFVYGDTIVCGNTKIYDNAKIKDGYICDSAEIGGNTWVYVCATICDTAKLCSSNDYIFIEGFGSSSNRRTTFFKTKDNGIGVSCGCFHGNIIGFRERVKKTHGENRYAKEYLALADLIEMRFKED